MADHYVQLPWRSTNMFILPPTDDGDNTQARTTSAAMCRTGPTTSHNAYSSSIPIAATTDPTHASTSVVLACPYAL